MLALYLGIYTFIIVLLWGFFIVAKIHAYKFKNFSNHIGKVTNILLLFLLVLTISGYIFILFGDFNSSTSSIDLAKPVESNINIEFDDNY